MYMTHYLARTCQTRLAVPSLARLVGMPKKACKWRACIGVVRCAMGARLCKRACGGVTSDRASEIRAPDRYTVGLARSVASRERGKPFGWRDVISNI